MKEVSVANLPQYVSLSQIEALAIRINSPIRDLVLMDHLRYAIPVAQVREPHSIFEYDQLAFAAYDALDRLPDNVESIDDVEVVQGIHFDESAMSYEADNDYGINDGKEMPFSYHPEQFLYAKHSSVLRDKKTKHCWCYRFESYDGVELMLWSKRPSSTGFEDRYWLQPLNLGPMISQKTPQSAGLPRDGYFSIEELERISGLPVQIVDPDLLDNPPLLDDPKTKQSRSNPVKDTIEAAYRKYQQLHNEDPTYLQTFMQMEEMSEPPIEVSVDWAQKVITVGKHQFDFDKSKDRIRQRYDSVHKKLRMNKDD